MVRTKSIPNRAELILSTAVELFSRYGYERTSIDDIAKHLGIGKGSIYLDFRTKEEILMRIIERYATSIEAVIEEKLKNLAGSPLQCLKETFLSCTVMVYDCVTRDIHTPEALLHTSLQFKPRFASFFIRKRERVLRILKLAAQAGEIPAERATEETAIAFLMAISSLSPPYFNNYSESDARITRAELEKRAQLILDIVIAGLKSSN